MGVTATSTGEDALARTVWMGVPPPAVALLNRLMALPKGIHTIVLVKDASGSRGLTCWTVVEGKTESPRGHQGPA